MHAAQRTIIKYDHFGINGLGNTSPYLCILCFCASLWFRCAASGSTAQHNAITEGATIKIVFHWKFVLIVSAMKHFNP